jgi:hypothetical protein
MNTALKAMRFGRDSDQEMPPIRSSVTTKAATAASKLTKMLNIDSVLPTLSLLMQDFLQPT